jgi:peptidoglycan/LPS O-acetylase OafA/YrhL
MGKPSQDANLDILRAVAVLAVFLTHGLQVTAGVKYGEKLAYGVDTFALGRIGVLLFFVHTSLVLMQSLERTSARLAGWDLVRHFYVRRAFRIYPLSICLILLSLAFMIPPNALGGAYRWQGWNWFLSNLFLVQNITAQDSVASPLWSLPFEVQMYLVLPLLFLALRIPRVQGVLFVSYLAGAVLSLMHPVFLYAPCFMSGVMAFKLLESGRPRFAAWLWFPALLGLVALYVGTPYSDDNWFKNVGVCLAT